MPTAAWAALCFFLVVSVAGTAWVGVQAFNAWRRLRATPSRLLRHIDALSVSVAALELRSRHLEGHGSSLQGNAAELSVSLARARTMVAAVEDVRNTIGGVRAFLPTK